MGDCCLWTTYRRPESPRVGHATSVTSLRWALLFLRQTPATDTATEPVRGARIP